MLCVRVKDINEIEKEKNITNAVLPLKDYKVLELFAGAGGLAVGLEAAGIECAALNEIDPWACDTLRKNRPDWRGVGRGYPFFGFTQYKGK